MTRVLYPCLCIDLINIDRVHFHFLPLNDDNDEGENDEDNVDEDDDNDDNDQYGDDDDDGGFDDKGCDRGVCLHSVNKRRALSLLSTQCFAVLISRVANQLTSCFQQYQLRSKVFPEIIIIMIYHQYGPNKPPF